MSQAQISFSIQVNGKRIDRKSSLMVAQKIGAAYVNGDNDVVIVNLADGAEWTPQPFRYRPGVAAWTLTRSGIAA